MRSSRTRGGGGGCGRCGGRRVEVGGLWRAAGGRAGVVVPVAVAAVADEVPINPAAAAGDCSPVESSRRLASAAALAAAAASAFLSREESRGNCIEPEALPGTLK